MNLDPAVSRVLARVLLYALPVAAVVATIAQLAPGLNLPMKDQAIITSIAAVLTEVVGALQNMTANKLAAKRAAKAPSTEAQ